MSETKTKYGKYFIRYDTSKWRPGGVPVLIHLEDKIIKGSNLYFVHWVFQAKNQKRDNSP